MKKRLSLQVLWFKRAEICLNILAIVTAGLLLIPVFGHVASDLATLSIVIYTPILLGLVVILIVLRRVRPIISPRLSYAAILLTLLCLIVPQARLLAAAHDADVRLRFNLYSYTSFTGTKSIPSTNKIPYKTVGKQQLHLALYPAKQKGIRSTVVYIHGGAWQFGSYLKAGNWPWILNNANINVISIEYRLAHKGSPTWQTAPQDITDAMNYIRGHAAQLGVDTTHLSLMGQSAGGQLALLEAYKNEQVRSVVSLYSPVDLTYDFSSARDQRARLALIGGSPTQYPDRYAAISPLTHIKPTSPSTFIIHGTSDTVVDTKNADLLSDKLSQYNVSYQKLLLPYTGHAFENQRGGFATQITEQTVVDFLKP